MQSECQPIWIQIKADVCNDYQQTTLASKQANSKKVILMNSKL